MLFINTSLLKLRMWDVGKYYLEVSITYFDGITK